MSLEVHLKSRSGPRKYVFIVLAGQLKHSRHLQGYQRAGALKSPIHNEMNEPKNHFGCLSKSFKKADQDLENIRFYSLGWPTEKQSTLAGLPTSRWMKKAPFTIVYEMNEHKNHVRCLSKSF